MKGQRQIETLRFGQYRINKYIQIEKKEDNIKLRKLIFYYALVGHNIYV